MHSSVLFRPLLKGILGLAVAGCVALAGAQQVGTWAWTQSFAQTLDTVHLGSVAEDSNLNSYALYRLGEETPGATIGLKAYDIYGNLLFTKLVLTTSIDANEGRVFVSQPVASTQYVYVTCTYTDAKSHQNILLNKYDTSGNLQWSHVISGGDGKAYSVGFDTDTSGNVYIASGITYPTSHLDLLELGPSGSAVYHATNTRITPDDIATTQAYHVTGYWIVSGSDNKYANSSMWGAFVDSTGILQGYNSYYDHRDTTSQYHYKLIAEPYNGGILAVTNIQYNKINYAPPHARYQLSQLTYAGVANWTSPWETGWISSINPGQSTNPSYLVGAADTTQVPFVQSISSTGAIGWTMPLSSGQGPFTIVPDVNGFFLTGWNTTGYVQGYLNRYDTTGAQQYSQSLATSSVTSITSDGTNTIIGGLSRTVGPQGGVIQRFVEGFALASVTTPSTTITAGQGSSFTANFNMAAPSAGQITFHSSDQNVLFSNNTNNIVVNYSMGQTSVQVPVTTKAIFGSQSVEVVATVNGVRRAVYATLVQ